MATATTTATLVPSRPWWYAFRRGRWFGYIYGGPVIIAFLIFNLYPMVLGLYLSFTKWDILSPPTFIDEPSGNGALNGIPVTVTAVVT